ncbi:glycosyltransferase family 4 protein [Brotaphodocola sp.]|uniref:glycosyltransferase family 4 protein n=1 Tax=Brotaphodocola sp. TaxID=3073577 RepID=UPI003D7E3285
MKIAMLGHKRIPSREGGIETVVTELAVKMEQRGNQVEAYNRWEPFNKELPKLPKEYRNVKIHKILTSQKSSLNAFIYSVLATCSATCRALFGDHDVLHYHAEGSCAMIWLPKLFRIPVVATIHGLDWKRAKWGNFATKYLLFGERVAARYADEIIVLSKDMQHYFLETYGRETHYLNNGIQVHDPVPPDKIRKFGLKEQNYILYLGRIVPEKGIHYLIEAFGGIDTDVKLVIAGNADKANPYAASICEKAAKDKRIIMTGFVEGQMLEELYSNCIAYVLPSDVEGMAITMLEAMSYGAHCIFSDIPENREVAGDYAKYFPVGDVKALRVCLQHAISLRETEKNADGEREIAYIKEKFGWDPVVDSTLDIYKLAIKKMGKTVAQSTT